METERAPYRGELFYEMLPERDPAVRHLGAKAVSLTLSGGAATTDGPSRDELPSFEVYLATKYPGLPPSAAAELTARFHELTRPVLRLAARTSPGDGRPQQ